MQALLAQSLRAEMCGLAEKEGGVFGRDAWAGMSRAAEEAGMRRRDQTRGGQGARRETNVSHGRCCNAVMRPNALAKGRGARRGGAGALPTCLFCCPKQEGIRHKA